MCPRTPQHLERVEVRYDRGLEPSLRPIHVYLLTWFAGKAPLVRLHCLPVCLGIYRNPIELPINSPGNIDAAEIAVEFCGKIDGILLNNN